MAHYASLAWLSGVRLIWVPSNLSDLVERLDEAARTWLPPYLSPGTPLVDALAAARPAWPEQRTGADAAGGPLLFPVAYTGSLKVTAAVFHQLLDACCEAARARSHVALAAVPLGRSGCTGDAAKSLQQICAALAAAGLPADPLADIRDLAGMSAHLVRRLCATSFTRRSTDLADLLVSAIADTAGTSWVYLAEPVIAGRHLSNQVGVAPLCRLYSADPFAAPPPYAKVLPAGSDALWATAFTMGLVDEPVLPRQRDSMEQAVRARVAAAWNRLRRQDLTAHRAVTVDPEPLRLRIDAPRPVQVVVPLFGAPRIGPATRALVEATALVADGLELVVDDLTPRFSYRAYSVDDARQGYTALAQQWGGRVSFLTDSGPGRLAEQIQEALRSLTLADLAAAAPRGKANRRRGGLTGYDAIHLGVMAVACAEQPRALLAVRSANLPAVHALTRVHRPPGLLVWSGTDQTAAVEVDRCEVRALASWVRAARPDERRRHGG
jgi:hypothetical protein